jgi:hypothetical protein
MSRARELAKLGGAGQQVIAGVSSHVGVSTFASNVFMYQDLSVTGNINVTGDLTYDEVSARNQNITGITTTVDLIVSRNASVAGILTATKGLTGNINATGISTATTLSGTTATYTNLNSTNTVHSGITTVSNTVQPNANNTVSLGTTSNRWANVYSNDLDLSNEGSANDIDGTWGSYLVQEGEEHLYIINRRSGKKFRFVLEEV